MRTIKKTSVNFIGAGKLGKALAKLFINTQQVIIKGVCNANFTSGQAAIKYIGQGEAFHNISELPSVDITFITTPDDLIKSCCEQLSNSTQLQPKSIIVHCSGILSSKILSSSYKKHCNIASVHPMRSFSELEINPEKYQGTFCAIEGDNAAKEHLTTLFTAIGSKIFEIDPNKKAIYHAAGVFASNYLVALFQQGLNCLAEASVKPELAPDIILTLMQNTLANLTSLKQAKCALTGPIQRGEISTIETQLAGFTDPNLKKLYKILGLATLSLTDLPEAVLSQLRAMFSAPEDL